MILKFERLGLRGYPTHTKLDDSEQVYCCDDMKQFLLGVWIETHDDPPYKMEVYDGGAFNFCVGCGEPVTATIE